jgi:hypothetical protein
MYQNDYFNEAVETDVYRKLAAFKTGFQMRKQKRMFIAHWIFLDILMKTEEHFVDWIKYRVNVSDNLYDEEDNMVIWFYWLDVSDGYQRFNSNYRKIDIKLYDKTDDCVIKIQAIIRGHNLRWRYPLIHIL